MALGSYPEVSLAQARKKTIEARELLAQGIDPKAQRNELLETKRAETEHTFENVATAWFELKKDSVTPAYAEDIWRSLTLHVFPEMRTTPLSEVTAPMVIKLLSNRSKRQSGDCETVEPTVDVPLLRGMCTFEHGAQEQRYVELGRHRRPPM